MFKIENFNPEEDAKTLHRSRVEAHFLKRGDICFD